MRRPAVFRFSRCSTAEDDMVRRVPGIYSKFKRPSQDNTVVLPISPLIVQRVVVTVEEVVKPQVGLLFWIFVMAGFLNSGFR